MDTFKPILLSLGLAASAQWALAGSIIYNPNGGLLTINFGDPLGQSFVAEDALVEAGLHIGPSNPDEPVSDITYYLLEGDSWGGAVVASKIISPPEGFEGYFLVDFTDTPLTVGNTYSLAAEIDGWPWESGVYWYASYTLDVPPETGFYAGGLGQDAFALKVLPVAGDASVDIMPDSDRNPVNLKSKGLIPVAILTSDTFDATQVDWETVRFGPSGAAERHQRVHVKDTDSDGDMDIVLHFPLIDTGILCGDTMATLTGQTFSGEEFTGSDTIDIVGCPN